MEQQYHPSIYLSIRLQSGLDIRIEVALRAYLASGIEEQVDYQKFYLYSIVTLSTAIEGSTANGK